MSDLVERLRAPAYWFSGSSEGHEGENNAPYEAAARIERLEAEGDKARARGDKLRMALEDIAYGDPLHNENDMMRIARAALEERT